MKVNHISLIIFLTFFCNFLKANNSKSDSIFITFSLAHCTGTIQEQLIIVKTDTNITCFLDKDFKIGRNKKSKLDPSIQKVKLNMVQFQKVQKFISDFQKELDTNKKCSPFNRPVYFIIINEEHFTLKDNSCINAPYKELKESLGLIKQRATTQN